MTDADRRARRERARVRRRGPGRVLPGRHAARVRLALAPHARRAARERGRSASTSTSASAAPVDFALWKAAKPGEPAWDSPWGPGRPGWHIECSAMSLEAPRRRLRHPRRRQRPRVPAPRERDRAGASARATSSRAYWMHNGMLNVDGEKMSKSLGNFTTLVDVLDQYDPRAFRLLVLQTHYRRQMEIGEKELVRRGEGGRAARRARAPRARRGLPDGRASATSRRSATRWTTTSTRPPRSPYVFELVRDANIALDEELRDDGRDRVRDRAGARGRARASSCAPTRPKPTPRSTRSSRRARRRGGPRTGPKPTASATSSRRAASSSRTRRAGPTGAASEQGRRPISAATRSKAGGRCSSCCARASARPRAVYLSSTVTRDDTRRRDRRAGRRAR